MIVMRCPDCGNELDENNYCDFCMEYFNPEDEDYNSMVNNGDEICLNCTFWSVSPYGASHGMICRRGYMTEGPGDSCSEFIKETHFGNYGDAGEFQFDDTGRAISNKLYYWQNSR